MKLVTSCLRYSAFGAVLILLPGCAALDWFKNKTAPEQSVSVPVTENVTIELPTPQASFQPVQGQVLVSVDGVPVITVESLKAEKDKLLAANPQLKAMMAFMDPQQFDQNLLDGLTNQVTVDKWIIQNGVANTQNYKNELQEGYKAIERMVNTKFFSESLKISVSDADVRKFYDTNKDLMPNLIISRGGTKAMGVQFDQEQDARAFADKVRARRGDISAAAKEAGIATDRVKDFKVVGDQTVGMEAALHSAILGMKSVPGVEVVKVNATWWVVGATERQESKYQPFEQVKAGLKAAVEKEKRAEMFDQAIERLKQDYKVVVDQNYFASAPAGAQQEMPDLTDEEIAALQEEMM